MPWQEPQVPRALAVTRHVDEGDRSEVAGDLHDRVVPVAGCATGARRLVGAADPVAPEVRRRVRAGVLRRAGREEDRLAVADELEDRVGQLGFSRPTSISPEERPGVAVGQCRSRPADGCRRRPRSARRGGKAAVQAATRRRPRATTVACQSSRLDSPDEPLGVVADHAADVPYRVPEATGRAALVLRRVGVVEPRAESVPSQRPRQPYAAIQWPGELTGCAQLLRWKRPSFSCGRPGWRAPSASR